MGAGTVAAQSPAAPPGVAWSGIDLRFSLDRYRLGVALAGGRVGDNAFLLDIARMTGARCAINGTFFAAYPGETKEPFGTLVVNGKLLHLGSFGTRLDVLDDGRIRMVRERLLIQGSLDGSDAYPYNWYAYNLNHTPTPGGSSAYIFTPERGPALGYPADMAIIARRGMVTAITRGVDVAIPQDGFVVGLQGKEVDVLGWKFAVGQRIEYWAVEHGERFSSRFSIGAGPRLVDHGRVAVDPIGEGFHDPKILYLRGQRSVVGLTADREVILAVINNATVGEAGTVMQALGAVDAMNLDDNASSGMVCDGRYLVRPGRQVPNGLVLWPVPR